MVKTRLTDANSRASAKLSPYACIKCATCSSDRKAECPVVHVIDGGMKSQRLQDAVSPDAEHDLLPDAHLPIAAIKLLGDMAIVRMRVERNVGIQQVERNSSDVHPPCLRVNRAFGEVHFHHHRLAARTKRDPHRKVVEVVVNMRFLLPSRLAEVLAEISLLVKQPDTHQRNVKITGGLEMVTGQYAQAAGKDGQALGESEFGGEVGDQQVLVRFSLDLAKPGCIIAQVSFQVRGDTIQMRQEGFVPGGSLQLSLFDGAEQQHRVVPARFP